MSLVTSGYQEDSPSSWNKRCGWKWVMAKSNLCHRIGQVFVRQFAENPVLASATFIFFLLFVEIMKIVDSEKKDIYLKKTRFCLDCKLSILSGAIVFLSDYSMTLVFFFAYLTIDNLKIVDVVSWWVLVMIPRKKKPQQNPKITWLAFLFGALVKLSDVNRVEPKAIVRAHPLDLTSFRFFFRRYFATRQDVRPPCAMPNACKKNTLYILKIADNLYKLQVRVHLIIIHLFNHYFYWLCECCC